MSMMGKALAGSVLGFILCAQVVALGLWHLPAHGQAVLVPALILFFPGWIAVIAASFMCSSARRAWLLLGMLDLIGMAALGWLHHGVTI